MGTFLIHTFGCRAAQAESAALGGLLCERGLVVAARPETADLVIVNTCTVTASADEDARQFIRRIHRLNPEARIIVTGCYAQRAPQELAALPGVCAVVGHSDRDRLPELARQLVEGSSREPQLMVRDVHAYPPEGWVMTAGVVEDRVRPVLKIQDGCSHRCSYCIIPLVRGRSRSAPLELVLEQVRRLAEQHCEIVLSGIDLGSWGRDLRPRLRLVDLVERLLAETPVRRLRLSSIEPLEWDQELLELVASSSRIAHHIHMPLQSGSDAILRRMRRRYRVRHYVDRVLTARRLMPEAAIGADVLVGFPGETDQDFEQTVNVIESLPLTYLHVFTYSPRPGTEAAQMPNQVPRQVRQERNRILRELAARKNLEFRRQMIGRKLSVVTLGEDRLALSDNYLKVHLREQWPPNQLIEVWIGGLAPDGLEEAPSPPRG